MCSFTLYLANTERAGLHDKTEINATEPSTGKHHLEATKYFKVHDQQLTLVLGKAGSTLPFASCPWLDPHRRGRLCLQPPPRQS